jgi:hypothetical protein
MESLAQKPSPGAVPLRFKAGPTYKNASLNGKQCKALEQTYDYDKESK